MANFIPEDKITEVQQAADIVEVVSEVVMLKKAGKDHVGLCPFHSEKTPSFTVSRIKQMFYCFGCGAGGNVFGFWMRYEGVSFPEAVRFLAGRYGIDIPTRRMSPEQRRRIAEKEGIWNINRQATAFFRQTLQESPLGKSARAYLKRRGISGEVAGEFSLGYAPAGWDHLLTAFARKRVSPAWLHKAGLVVPNKRGNGFYDRFRDRIVFPITDVRMQVTGFGGRVMDDSLPKYLNSPETSVFNKSRSLYGLHTAKRPCRETDEVYLTEGYVDVLSLWQYGIRNVVATLGTALTPDHVRLLRGCAARAVLVYDSDQAGIRAAWRSVGVFRKENMEARILILPRGHDPDSFVREFGPDAFRKAARNAADLMTFLIEEAVRKYGLSVEGKIRIISAMQKPLASVPDETERILYVRNLADRIGVDAIRVLDTVREGVFQSRKAESSPRGLAAHRREEARPPRKKEDRSAEGFFNWTARIEKKLIAMMLQFPEIIPEIERRDLLSLFENSDLRFIGQVILEHKDRLGSGCAEIANYIGDEEKRRMAASLAFTEDEWNHDGCLRLIEQFESGKKRRENSLQQKIQAAIRANDRTLLDALLREKLNQARERQSIT